MTRLLAPVSFFALGIRTLGVALPFMDLPAEAVMVQTAANGHGFVLLPLHAWRQDVNKAFRSLAPINEDSFWGAHKR